MKLFRLFLVSLQFVTWSFYIENSVAMNSKEVIEIAEKDLKDISIETDFKV